MSALETGRGQQELLLNRDVEERRGLEDLRGLTFGIAYRMTGSVSDAEDLSQEAFVRLEESERSGGKIESRRAWISTVTTRLAIDHLRSARVRRERYVGPWLPEPLLTDESPGPAEHAEVADSLSQAFLVLLERLSPVERAVFLLREVFGFEYAQVADAVGRSEVNCRQIATRARKHVDANRTRFEPDDDVYEKLLDRFIDANENGDVDALKELLSADAVVYSDGGGKVVAARVPFGGVERIAHFMVKIWNRRHARGASERRDLRVNGRRGWIWIDGAGAVEGVLTIEVAEGRIRAIRIVRNPDKLRHV